MEEYAHKTFKAISKACSGQRFLSNNDDRDLWDPAVKENITRDVPVLTAMPKKTR